MTETTARIRWADSADIVPGYGIVPAWTGHVGGGDSYLFLITKQSLDGDDYALLTELPWMGKKRSRDPDPDKLKAVAERWLEEFAASIGAAFPDTLREAFRSERDKCEDAAARLLKDHQYDTGMRRQGWADALDWVLAEIDRGAPSASGGAGKE